MKLAYEIVEHDGGWAYRLDGTYSETFPSRSEAAQAAGRAAAEQQLAGETAGIVYQDAAGIVHEEIVDGGDRPDAGVIDKA